MNLKVESFLIFPLIISLSCSPQQRESDLSDSEKTDSIEMEISKSETRSFVIEKETIIAQLQGKWKETEYPFRTAEFVQSTVKFVEEGIEDKQIFEDYELSTNCEYNNNNIRDLTSKDVILSMPRTGRCEKLAISEDTLMLSGFSANTNEVYNIIYLKVVE